MINRIIREIPNQILNDMSDEIFFEILNNKSNDIRNEVFNDILDEILNELVDTFAGNGVSKGCLFGNPKNRKWHQRQPVQAKSAPGPSKNGPRGGWVSK